MRAGETLGIMGRNGSGKSTLLKILCGIYRADSGTLDVRAPITPILELGLGWNPELDGVDNVLLIGTAMGLSLREAKASLDEILAFAGLERFAGMPLKHYSSGMASRLAYSVAFKAVRDVLVLDEIFAVGDQEFRARCEARYRDLHAPGAHRRHRLPRTAHRLDLLHPRTAPRGRVDRARGHRRGRRGRIRPATERRLGGTERLIQCWLLQLKQL